jgi:hypothetical protein
MNIKRQSKNKKTIFSLIFVIIIGFLAAAWFLFIRFLIEELLFAGFVRQPAIITFSPTGLGFFAWFFPF